MTRQGERPGDGTRRARPREVVVNDTMQQRLSLRPDRARGTRLRRGLPPPADAQADARAGRLRRQVHDRLPRRVPGGVVRAGQALPERHDPALNFFGVDASRRWPSGGEGLDPRRTTRAAGSSGTAATTWAGAMPRRGRAADRPLEGDASGTSPRSRSNCTPGDLTCRPPPAAGAAALGVRLEGSVESPTPPGPATPGPARAADTPAATPPLANCRPHRAWLRGT